MFESEQSRNCGELMIRGTQVKSLGRNEGHVEKYIE